jgi:hypothetical protein
MNSENMLLQTMGMLLEQMRRNAGYLARAEIERILEPLRSDPYRLEPYGYKVYSQNDEDGILHEIFRRLGITQGTFCELGVESGRECNSLYLLHKGWRGCWIEGDQQQQAPIQKMFASLLNSRRLSLGIGYITAENINTSMQQVLELIGLKADQLDFLSIDVDGNDIYLLEVLDVSPKVICIEYNAKFPASLSKQAVYNPAHQWRGGDYMGSSLLAIDTVAREKGYVLVGTNLTGANAFYVRSELAEGKFSVDSSVEHLYNSARYWLCYDHFSGIGHKADFGPYLDLETRV